MVAMAALDRVSRHEPASHRHHHRGRIDCRRDCAHEPLGAVVAHNENLLRLNRWTGVVGMCVEAKPVAKGTEAYDPKTGERLMLRNNEWVNEGPNRAQRRRVDPRRIS
jgi:hypothetical protein